MTLESWLAVALFLLGIATAGIGWWCRTLWNQVQDARSETRATASQIAPLRLECAERDASIWSALRTFQTEVARQYAGREEIQKLRDDLMGEFRRLEDKLDRLTERN